MNYQEIAAFCINLDTRPERWRQATEQFARLEWSVTRQAGVVYSASPYAALDPPHAGCLDSHKAIWRQCVERNLGVVAVFEDDVVFPSYFKDIFVQASAQLPAGWALWLLHSFRARTARYSENLVRIKGSAWGTHAYLVTQRACELLLGLPDDKPADGRVTTGLLSQSTQVFGSSRARTLAFQRGDDSDIPSTAQVEFWRRQRQLFCQ